MSVKSRNFSFKCCLTAEVGVSSSNTRSAKTEEHRGAEEEKRVVCCGLAKKWVREGGVVGAFEVLLLLEGRGQVRRRKSKGTIKTQGNQGNKREKKKRKKYDDFLVLSSSPSRHSLK